MEATTATESLMEVAHTGGERYEITIGRHRIVVDQPIEAGGADTAPTPTEILVASLAGCVAFYAGRYLTRHGIDRSGLTVRAGFTMAADRPARVASIRIAVSPPPGFPAGRLAALRAVVEHCTVHNTMTHPPAIEVSVS